MLITRSFSEDTDYSDGCDVVALVEEIRSSRFYLPELSFIAKLAEKTVGYFMFSQFPLSEKPVNGKKITSAGDIVMLAPVAVHADFLREGIGKTMLTLGIEAAEKSGYKGITVEGNNLFYNKLGFVTSSKYGIYPTSGRPLENEEFMMCMELYPGSLSGIKGYVVYDMYYNA